MMTILAIVNAEKEGQIESKMIKARQMEEIREAKRKEAEARAEKKKSKLENIKDELRHNKKKNNNNNKRSSDGGATDEKKSSFKSREKRKSVSFA